MEQEKFSRIVDDLNVYKGILEVILLDETGEILYRHGEDTLSAEEARNLLSSWKNKESAIAYNGYRYAMVKKEEIQLAAKNTSDGMGSVVGSITNEGDYLIAHIGQETEIILLEWSILINKLAWG
ncbi:MAG: hypothetical protein JW891_07055 [Candidatus Lokiarchaeota archaeon]|nr:hypothetical protein [Candidatus Lokiarchaeota archaeon]